MRMLLLMILLVVAELLVGPLHVEEEDVDRWNEFGIRNLDCVLMAYLKHRLQQLYLLLVFLAKASAIFVDLCVGCLFAYLEIYWVAVAAFSSVELVYLM